MFISTYTGSKRISELKSILSFIPKPIFNELDDLTIVYRGIVEQRGRKGDLLIRIKDDQLLNIIWNKKEGEVRRLDRGLLNNYVDSYDETIKNLVVKEGSRTLNKLYIINIKIIIPRSKKN